MALGPIRSYNIQNTADPKLKMSKSQEFIKQEKFIKKLEALAKCREGTARRERAAAKRARGETLLPSDTAPYIIKYNELEPSPTTRDLEEGLVTVSVYIFACDTDMLMITCR